MRYDRFLAFVLFLLLILVCALKGEARANCTTVQPGPDWVCVNGGWLPPGMAPQQPGQAVPPSAVNPNVAAPPGLAAYGWPTNASVNAAIVQHFKAGTQLPNGDIYFAPPLVLYGGGILKGGPFTRLLPNTMAPANLVLVISDTPGNPFTGYPNRIVFENVHIQGHSGQNCIVLAGAFFQAQVITSGCSNGVRFDWAVNVEFTNSIFVGHDNGWMMPISAVNTTVSCVKCRWAHNRLNGMYTGNSWSVVLERPIFEYNGHIGLHVGCGSKVLVRDSHFEGNPVDIYGCSPQLEGLQDFRP